MFTEELAVLLYLRFLVVPSSFSGGSKLVLGSRREDAHREPLGFEASVSSCTFP